jgi:hypothetical protein
LSAELINLSSAAAAWPNAEAMAELQQQMQAMMLQMQQLAAENKQLRAAQQNPQGAAPMQLEEEEEPQGEIQRLGVIGADVLRKTSSSS